MFFSYHDEKLNNIFIKLFCVCNTVARIIPGGVPSL